MVTYLKKNYLRCELFPNCCPIDSMELLLFLLVLVLAICGMWSVSILVTVGRLRQYNTHGISRPGQTIEREIRQATRNNVPDIL